MRKLLDYLVLPKEVSPTEKAHVERINRIALVAFFAHIPIFAGVAWLCETGPLFAVALSLLTLFGPTVAYFQLRSHRAISAVFGFTAMCMGGLLVHFGQGPMQIEMHFYFFVLLALLATYGNPAVNILAAATAAVHHFLLWILLPSSVFNYDASIWVVLVHALFVVIETVAAVFIARSFYDNVIGLEKIVAARTREVEARNRDMRRVLDHVAQGLLTLTPSGQIGDERSRVVDGWLGAPPPSGRLSDWVRAVDPKFATWLDLAIEELAEDILPREVVIGQLPGRFEIPREEGKQTFSVDYKPIESEDGELERLLVVITDITAQLQQAEAEAEQRENLKLFELIGADASGFEEFYDEANRMLRRIIDDPDLDLVDLKRLVHTLKGNTALFGLERVSKRFHVLEDHIESTGDRPAPEDLQTLDRLWRGIDDKVRQLTGGDRKSKIVVPVEDLDGLLTAVRAGHSGEALERRITRMHLEPTTHRLTILAEQASKIAARLGRGNVVVAQEAEGDLRIDAKRWSSFWSSLVHVLRNAVDHGLEPAEEREKLGKAAEAQLRFRAFARGERMVLAIEDDGRGIDLERLAEKARAAGHAFASEDELLLAVFLDGVSTRDAVSETSGRGVGMAAVRAEAEALGGEVRVETEAGRGTRFEFVFPVDDTTLPPEEVR
jgi:signal transduction histidine kinase